MSLPEPPRDFVEAVHQALRLWHKEPGAGSQLQCLILVQQQQANGANLRRATNEVLLEGLKVLGVEREPDAALLRARFLDGKPVFLVANERNVAEVTVYKLQRRAIVQLARTLLGMEQRAALERQATVAIRLPSATYDRLLGVEHHLQHLTDLLLAADGPRLVAIEGLGGLGKTALAHQLVIRLAAGVSRFANFGWVSARRPLLEFDDDLAVAETPALTAADFVEALAAQFLGSGAPVGDRALAALETRLHQAPHLIVVDNLETIADVAGIAPTLAQLAGPTKFLLTSRATFQGPIAIYRFPVPELSETDSLELVRHEARLRNISHVAGADDAALRPLFTTVGGNPLALRLVTGQLHLLSLAKVIEDLREAQGKRTEELYRFIYWKAWQQLPADAQDTLLLMPLFAGDGADLPAVRHVSDLPDRLLIEALDYLTRLCLVTVSGDLETRRYSIHRLTESFLLKEVLKWQGLREQRA